MNSDEIVFPSMTIPLSFLEMVFVRQAADAAGFHLERPDPSIREHSQVTRAISLKLAGTQAHLVCHLVGVSGRL
jgi:hypothetical protein